MEICNDCSREFERQVDGNLNKGVVWLCPDEKWICPECLDKRKRQVLYSGQDA